MDITAAAAQGTASSNGVDPHRQRLQLLDLPEDILSQIASYLPLDEQIHFLSLHPALLSLTQSYTSPLPTTIRSILSSSQPYPALFARLPSLSLYTPNDGGRMFIDVLVRARPRWIIERLEFGRWNDSIWREAFERRFLRSWKRYKTDDDTWRSVFLRMLGRLEHRHLGCTHEESWTRFITLHRNGSASINRIYSRLFDPYDIYEELKHQNNFSVHPTQVRVFLHLQDVRILAIGCLISTPSLFVNPNAHLLLHPPLLRDLPTIHNEQRSHATSPPITINVKPPTASITPGTNANEAYFPLVRSISPSGPAQTTYGLGESPAGPSSPSSPRLLSTFARVLPRRRTGSNASEESDGWRGGGGLMRVISRDRDRDRERDDSETRRRTWSFGRARADGPGTVTLPSGIPAQIRPTEPLTPSMPTLPELSPPTDNIKSPPTPPHTPPPLTEREKRMAMPYPRLLTPQPAVTYRNYPNYPLDPHRSRGDLIGARPIRGDRRVLHEEIEDAGPGAIWSGSDIAWGDGRKMAEWDEIEQTRKRWVGPMILVAQLHPSDRESAHPPGADPNGPVEGAEPDLGPKGTYASIGFEDIEDIMPWLEFRGGAGNCAEALRSGLGFE